MKQVEALKSLKPEENHELKSTEEPFRKEMRTNEIKKEIYEIKQKDLIHKANDSIYDFQPFEMIRCFGDNTYTVKTSMDEAIFQKIWQDLIIKLDQKKKIRKKRNAFYNVSAPYEGQELSLNASKSRIFPI